MHMDRVEDCYGPVASFPKELNPVYSRDKRTYTRQRLCVIQHCPITRFKLTKSDKGGTQDFYHFRSGNVLHSAQTRLPIIFKSVMASASTPSALAVTANRHAHGVITRNRRSISTSTSSSSSKWRVRCAIYKSGVATPAEAPPRAEAPKMGAECVVIGAGISGLCTAQALATRHAMWGQDKILVTEARDRVGGNITTVENGEGYLWEEGPNSFQPSEAVLTSAVDAGLREDLVFGDPDAPRFVFWDGRLRPVPGKPTDLPFFDLMSFPGKIRAGAGAVGLRPPPPVCAFL